ncbi:DUF4386 family protein [Ferrimonas marina]|uniref:DUF4386 domain-containing protein n=1 Tax=Ferrimonas marina TaxID=299255 RepID=A0A1M5MR71_9GAMM|nr:DUF4386 family protein [Ferrimonas marina]SHG79811.1 protein of unknown function [Ferrimonas marina]
MNNLTKPAGVASVFLALIYIAAFVYFGAFWSYPSAASPAEKMAYLAANQVMISAIFFLMYVLFGVVLTVLVVGLYEQLKHTNNPLNAISTVFGLVWVGLVIASGMISTIGLAHAIDLMDSSLEKAFDIWNIVSLLTESLGGGNEIVGGLWVLIVSIVALRAGVFRRALNYLGLFVGLAGIATIYPSDLATETFGISQIVWFIWLGMALLGRSNANNKL